MNTFGIIVGSILLLTLAGVVGSQTGFISGKASSDRQWQKTTVDRGLAIYCPSNGKWAWLGECKQ